MLPDVFENLGSERRRRIWEYFARYFSHSWTMGNTLSPQEHEVNNTRREKRLRVICEDSDDEQDRVEEETLNTPRR